MCPLWRPEIRCPPRRLTNASAQAATEKPDSTRCARQPAHPPAQIRIGRQRPDRLDPLLGRGWQEARHARLDHLACTPTGLATTGSPAAWYWRTFSPHLPRLQGSSGSQLMPICPAARSRASHSSDQGTGTTGSA